MPQGEFRYPFVSRDKLLQMFPQLKKNEIDINSLPKQLIRIKPVNYNKQQRVITLIENFRMDIAGIVGSGVPSALFEFDFEGFPDWIFTFSHLSFIYKTTEGNTFDPDDPDYRFPSPTRWIWKQINEENQHYVLYINPGGRLQQRIETPSGFTFASVITFLTIKLTFLNDSVWHEIQHNKE